MLINYIILALSVSIDSMGIGVTYGIRNTKINFLSKLILFFISLFITTFGILVGNILANFLEKNILSIIGSLLLSFIGIWIIYQAITTKRKGKKVKKKNNIYTFFIKFLGITIQIIKDPKYSDLDNSKNIDWKEALYLGFTLSIDSLTVGIGGSIIGLNSISFPILVSFFQIIFLFLGRKIGKNLKEIINIPDNVWNIISGILLIFIGLSKFLSK